MFKLSQRDIPKEGLITNGGFISPDGKYYFLDEDERHAEWIFKYNDWLKENGYDIGLNGQETIGKGETRGEIRKKLINLGWIRTRNQFGILFITCKNPHAEFGVIKKFLNDHKDLYDIENSFVSISDTKGNVAEDLMSQINSKKSDLNAEETLKKCVIKSNPHKTESGGDVYYHTILYNPENNQTIAYITWMKKTNMEAIFDILEIRQDFRQFEQQIEKMFREYLNNNFSNYTIKWSNLNIFKKISNRDLPTLTFLIGIPGSGKSTFINNNKFENTLIINPDSIRKELTGNISDRTRNYEVWTIAKQRAKEALSKNINVIIDGTNTAKSRRLQFINGLPPHKLQAKRFEGNPEETFQRIKKQLENGEDRSNVPLEAINNIYNTFKQQSNPEQLIEEGFNLL